MILRKGSEVELTDLLMVVSIESRKLLVRLCI